VLLVFRSLSLLARPSSIMMMSKLFVLNLFTIPGRHILLQWTWCHNGTKRLSCYYI
jgi:hypothetical protein